MRRVRRGAAGPQQEDGMMNRLDDRDVCALILNASGHNFAMVESGEDGMERIDVSLAEAMRLVEVLLGRRVRQLMPVDVITASTMQ
jgi:hypothetical protein